MLGLDNDCFSPSSTLATETAPYFDRLCTSPMWTLHWDLPHSLLAGAAFVALLLKVDILWVVVSGVFISVVLFR